MRTLAVALACLLLAAALPARAAVIPDVEEVKRTVDTPEGPRQVKGFAPTPTPRPARPPETTLPGGKDESPQAAGPSEAGGSALPIGPGGGEPEAGGEEPLEHSKGGQKSLTLLVLAAALAFGGYSYWVRRRS